MGRSIRFLLARMQFLFRLIGQEGIIQSTKVIFSELQGLVYQDKTYYLLKKTLSVQRPVAGVGGEPFTIVALDETHVPALERVSFYGSHEIHERLNRGEKAVLVLTEDQVVHHSWLSLKNAYAREIDEVITMKPGQALVYNCRTMPTYRNQGIFLQALKQIEQTAIEDGCHELLALVESKNRASLRSFEELKYVRKQEISYKKSFFRVKRASH